MGKERGRVYTCQLCAAAIPDGQQMLVRTAASGATASTMCPTCAGAAPYPSEGLQSADLGLGIAAAVVAAIGSSLVWYGAVVVSNYQVGLIAVAVGWLVARAAVFGAGGRGDLRLQTFCVVATVAAMAASEYFIVRHFAVQAYAEEGITGLPLFLPIGDMVQVVVDSLKGDPATMLFWAIAMWTAFRVPARASRTT